MFHNCLPAVLLPSHAGEAIMRYVLLVMHCSGRLIAQLRLTEIPLVPGTHQVVPAPCPPHPTLSSILLLMKDHAAGVQRNFIYASAAGFSVLPSRSTARH
jgi:hypothetical protein